MVRSPSNVSRDPQMPMFNNPPAHICVVGVGGGGCNAIMRMLNEKRVPGVRYIGLNTDIKSLQQIQNAEVLQIGESLTRGMGAGGNPEKGAEAAEKTKKAIKQALSGPDLVFLAVGMGGGTGTGAAPVVAEIAKEAGALVVAVATTPFSFEGAKRQDIAGSGIRELRGKVDNIIVIHNDRLISLMDEDVSMETALKRADDAVMLGVHSVAALVNMPGEINVDLADVKTIMGLSGSALMAIGEGKGPGGALEAAKQAVNNPLLNISIEGAMGVLFNVSGGPNLKLGEVNETGEYIRSLVDPDALIFFGMGNDRSLKDRARVTLIATGIPSSSSGDPREPELAKLLNEVGDGFGKIDLDLPPFLRSPRLYDKNR